MRYLYALILIEHSFERGTRGIPVPHHPLLVRYYETILVGPGYCGNILLREAASGPPRRADEIAQVWRRGFHSPSRRNDSTPVHRA